MSEFEPGPWFALPRRQKVLRWLRYQPVHKARMAWVFLSYIYGWHREYKHYPHVRTFGDREGPEGELFPPPYIVWEITVAQDAPGLERYWLWVRNDDDEK